MIIKKSEMKAKSKASFRNLYKYLASEKTLEPIRNIGMWMSSSEYELEDIDIFVKDIEVTQKSNMLSKDDKTYHLIVSFAPNEKPDFQTLKAIEKDIVKKLGYEKHQRIAVAHDDTDNFHFHIAINKVNPETFKIKTPYRDYKALSEVAKQIESQYNLIATNHDRAENSYSRAKDIDINSFKESLNAYVKKINLDEIDNWQGFHDKLNENGIKYVKKGQGAVFVTIDDKIGVKASSVNRAYSLSNIEKKFGEFNNNLRSPNIDKKPIKKIYDKRTVLNNQLFEQYKEVNENRKLKIKDDKAKNKILFDKENKTLNSEIDIIKQAMDIALLGEVNAIERLIIKNLFKSMIKDKRDDFLKKKQAKSKQVYQDNPYTRFSDWLKTESKTNKKAEELLNIEATTVNVFVGDFSDLKKDAVAVTTRGTYILNKDIRFTSKTLKVNTHSKIIANLEFYAKHNRKPLIIYGDAEFKKAVVKIVAENNLEITFADKFLQSKVVKIQEARKKLLNQFNEDRNAKMFSYKPFDLKEQVIQQYHGFIKYEEQFFILTKAVDKNVFYIKEPVSDDYKVVKSIKKGDEVAFNTDNRNSIMIESLINQKEKEAYKYVAVASEKDIENAKFKGIRYFQGKPIKVYQKDNIFYSMLANKEQKIEKSQAHKR